MEGAVAAVDSVGLLCKLFRRMPPWTGFVGAFPNSVGARLLLE